MSEDIKIGCSRPASTGETLTNSSASKSEDRIKKEERIQMIKVGKSAPAFSAPAFYKGEFTNIDLESFKGKWVLLCFYPGDFTFV